MNNSELYLHCQVSSGLLLAEAPAPLHNIRLLTLEGEEVPAPVLSCEELEEGLWRTRIDASQLYCWSPETPVLYRFVSDEVEQRFGYCEIRRFQNKAVLFNGSPIYFRGIIRGFSTGAGCPTISRRPASCSSRAAAMCAWRASRCATRRRAGAFG